MELDLPHIGGADIDGMWCNENITEYNFRYRSFLEKLASDIHSVMLKYLKNYPYNSILSIVRFYEEFKEQNLPLLEFYETKYKTTIYKDSQNCIGRALYLRSKLLKCILHKYPNLERDLFLSTSNPYFSDVIPIVYLDKPPKGTGELKDHACLMLKFVLGVEKRRGYIVIDPGFLIDFPIVVMEDSQPPHTGKFFFRSGQGDREYEFKWHSENYIHWISIVDDPHEKKEKKVTHRWFFVGLKLKNVLQIQKRNQLYAFHALAYGGLAGAVSSCYSILGEKDHFVISTFPDNIDKTKSNGTIRTSLIPFSYFVTRENIQNNAEWDEAINNLCSYYPNQDELWQLLKSFSIMATDHEFVNALHTFNKICCDSIENSFSE